MGTELRPAITFARRIQSSETVPVVRLETQRSVGGDIWKSKWAQLQDTKKCRSVQHRRQNRVKPARVWGFSRGFDKTTYGLSSVLWVPCLRAVDPWPDSTRLTSHLHLPEHIAPSGTTSDRTRTCAPGIQSPVPNHSATSTRRCQPRFVRTKLTNYQIVIYIWDPNSFGFETNSLRLQSVYSLLNIQLKSSWKLSGVHPPQECMHAVYLKTLRTR